MEPMTLRLERPNEKQAQFLACRAKYIAFVGKVKSRLVAL